MKCVLLFAALVAVWISGSDAAKKCEDIATCAGDMSKFANMDQSKMKEACKSMRDVFSCFKESMEDCKAKNPGNQQQFQMMESQMENVETMINQHCGEPDVVEDNEEKENEEKENEDKENEDKENEGHGEYPDGGACAVTMSITLLLFALLSIFF